MPGSCIMQVNTFIDGYSIGADGKCSLVTNLSGWQQDAKGWKYYDPSTHQITIGWKQLVDGVYYFGINGYMAINTVIDGHTIGMDGKMIN